jgi:predicted dehydrogenase
MTPQTTIRWGVLGTARITARIAPALSQAEGSSLTAIASRSPERAAAWASEHRVSRVFDSYAALLDDPEIDAVYIPLPPVFHREWTIRAAERRKHVLCEKPLALCASEAAEMAAACREHGVQLMDGVMWLHHPRAADMQRILQSGALGALRRVTAAFTFFGSHLPQNDHRYDPAMGGGSLLDLGWYCVGAALWAFEALPQRVYATARYRRGVDVDLSGLLWFGEDRVAAFDSGFETSMRKWLEIAGTEGSVVCDDFTRPWKPEKPRFWLHGADGKSAEHVSAAPLQEVAMIERFCELVRNGRPDEHWPQFAVDVQRVSDALAESARSQGVVELT